MDEPSTGRHAFRTTRLEFFSDGVFAIAITLLVLELHVSPDSSDDLLAAILAQWPSFLAYIVSFATIGALWLAHNAVTEYLNRVDATFIRINLLLLLIVAFIPFPTRLLAEHAQFVDAERVAATFYGLTLLLASIVVIVLWRYAVRAGLVRPDTSGDDVRILTARLTPGLVGYVAIIALGLFLPMVAIFGYLLIALFFLIPFRLRRVA